MRNSWSIIYLTKDYEAFRAFFLESGKTAGDWSVGLNVAALVVSLNLPWPSKFIKKVIILRLNYLESCRSFDSFNPDASLKIILVHFFLVTRSISICCLWGLVVPLFCSLTPKIKILNFRSEIVKRLFGSTHVFGRNFTFCNFAFIGGALNLLRHVVELSVSLTMS